MIASAARFVPMNTPKATQFMLATLSLGFGASFVSIYQAGRTLLPTDWLLRPIPCCCADLCTHSIEKKDCQTTTRSGC